MRGRVNMKKSLTKLVNNAYSEENKKMQATFVIAIGGILCCEKWKNVQLNWHIVRKNYNKNEK